MFKNADDLIGRRNELAARIAELEASGPESRDLHTARSDLYVLTLQIVARYQPEIRQFVLEHIKPRPDCVDLAVGLGQRAAANAVSSFNPGSGEFGTWVFKRVRRDLVRAARELGLCDEW